MSQGHSRNCPNHTRPQHPNYEGYAVLEESQVHDDEQHASNYGSQDSESVMLLIQLTSRLPRPIEHPVSLHSSTRTPTPTNQPTYSKPEFEQQRAIARTNTHHTRFNPLPFHSIPSNTSAHTDFQAPVGVLCKSVYRVSSITPHTPLESGHGTDTHLRLDPPPPFPSAAREQYR